METKGVPFWYLEFSRAIRGKPCPHVRARRYRWWRPALGAGTGFRLGFPTRSGSFWIGSHGYGLQRIVPAPLSEPATAQRLTGNRREPLQRLGGFCLKRTIATVQTEPLQPSRRICPSRSAINSAPFLSNKITPKTLQHTEKEILLLHSEVELLQFRFRSDFQQEVRILQLGFRSEFQEILKKIRSERKLRKFNRFFNRIVVWICDFQRRIFFYLPHFSTVGAPPK